MKHSPVIVLTIFAVFAAQSALADSVLLLNGDVYVGTLKNQESVLQAPLLQTYLIFVVDEPLEFLRIPQEDIDFIIIDRGGRPQVLAYEKMRAEGSKEQLDSTSVPLPESYQEINTDSSPGRSGVPLMVIGGALFLGSVLNKAGNTTNTMGTISLTAEGTHYNVLNYALMIVGAGLVYGGIKMETNKPPARWQYSEFPESRPGDSFGVESVVGLRIGF